MKLDITAGMRSRTRKLSQEDVDDMRRRRAAGESYDELHRRYPQVTRTAIGQICLGRKWRGVA